MRTAQPPPPSSFAPPPSLSPTHSPRGCAPPLQAMGRIRHNRLVYFDGDGAALRGRLVMVRMDECNAYSLFGKMVRRA